MCPRTWRPNPVISIANQKKGKTDLPARNCVFKAQVNHSRSRSCDLSQVLNWVCGKHWGIRSFPGKSTPLLRQNGKGQGMRRSFGRIGQEWNYTFSICSSIVWRWKWVEKQKGKAAPPSRVNLALVPIKYKSGSFYRESFSWSLCFRYNFLLLMNQ